jgi:hypothetical protein
MLATSFSYFVQAVEAALLVVVGPGLEGESGARLTPRTTPPLRRPQRLVEQNPNQWFAFLFTPEPAALWPPSKHRFPGRLPPARTSGQAGENLAGKKAAGPLAGSQLGQLSHRKGEGTGPR